MAIMRVSDLAEALLRDYAIRLKVVAAMGARLLWWSTVLAVKPVVVLSPTFPSTELFL
jgi:hypothetical protein